MRAICAFLCAAVVFSTISASHGQEGPTGAAVRFQRGGRAAAAAETQRAGRLVSVEVVIADVADDAEQEMTAERLTELEKAGKVASLSRLRVSTLENAPSIVQFGERVSIVTGRTSFGGRGSQDMLSQENVGTMVSLTARVDHDDSILIEFQAEQSRLAPAATKADGENAERPVEMPRTMTITTKSTLRILPGKSVVAGSKATRTDHGTTQTWILVSAMAEAAARDEAAVLKIMTLKNAQAEGLARLLEGVFRGEDFRAAVDARSNKLIISGNPALLERIIPLVAELDQSADEGAK